MKRVLILGAGIAGLAAGFFLQKRGWDVRILEKSNRAGGFVQSIEKEGFLFERGPRGFRTSGKGAATLALAQELGLKPVFADRAAKRRYVYLDGKLQPFSLFFLIKHGLLRALLRDLHAKKGAPDETIESFFLRRIGKPLTDAVIDPLTKGIFGGAMNTLSIRACFPHFYGWEKEYGSLLRGFWHHKKEPGTLATFEGGMERLTRTLASRLPIEFDTEVRAINERSVHTSKGIYTADHIITTLPANIPALSITTVNLGYRGNILPKRGFGYLIPSKEQEPLLGVTFDSAIFREQNTRLCAMLSYAENAVELTLDALKRHLGITATPISYDVHTAHRAIPQYLPYYTPPTSPHITYIGSSYTGVGINDCIAAASSITL